MKAWHLLKSFFIEENPPIPSPTFCAMPWVNLSTDTNGKCKPCCIIPSKGYLRKENGEDFQIQRDDTTEIFNSPQLREMRLKMLRGEQVAECNYCYGVESSRSPSPRQGYNKDFWNERLAKKVNQSKRTGGTVHHLPISFEPRPGSLCNLKCNICWSPASSKVQNERERALSGEWGPLPDFLYRDWSQEREFLKNSDLDWSENKIYLDNFRRMMPELKRVYFIGGEPTLIESNLEMLRELLKVNRRDIKVAFSTNLTHINRDLLSLLSKFESVEISGSLDGFELGTEYLRAPSRWRQQVENLFKLVMLTNVKVNITPVVQVSNVVSIVNLVKWLAEQPALRNLEVHPFFLEEPEFLRMDIVPVEMRGDLLRHLQSLDQVDLVPRNRETMSLIVEQLRKPEHPRATELRKQFREYTTYIDGVRGLEFSKAFPEMAGLLKSQPGDVLDHPTP